MKQAQPIRENDDRFLTTKELEEVMKHVPETKIQRSPCDGCED